ncbi:MAG TPA: response regulator [Candidatus Hydrogenedentes bacterium]|nr:response regulator [Candidatus Hydrogenedentota bacterium]HOL77338.1 response regulator [Candidatus Hydrogenedentota bacterium]HPO84844.1 response regulator [Candidatus Hydrogenedentota bacterium]
MSNKRILIVDDEENIRFALKRWFEWNGYEVDVADDGDVAVEKCRSSAYDVVTLDIEMPRMNGKHALKVIRECRPETKVIVLTGYSEELTDPALQGAQKIMIKPVSLTVLEKEVRELIETP